MTNKLTKREISQVMAHLGRKSGKKKTKEHFQMMAKKSAEVRRKNKTGDKH